MREGWGKRTLGEIFELSGERVGISTDDVEVLSVTKYDGVVLASQYFDKRVASKSLEKYKLLNVGDWAYSTIHIDEGSIARNNTNISGAVSPMYTTMRMKGQYALPRMMEHILRSPEMLNTYYLNQQGSINRRRSLPWKAFETLSVTLPPLHEQRRIVDLMDSVDAAISAAQAEVDAATEVLGALRDQLPAGRPGTVGDIVREIVNGVTTTARDQASGTGVQRFVKASAVQPGEFLPEETKQAPDVKFDEKYYVRQGDVLMTRINTPERVGNIARVSSEVEGLLRPDLVWRIEVGPNAVPDYLVNALSGKRGRARVSVAAAGTSRSMQQISKSRFLKVELPIPSTEAQHEYVSICRSAQLAVLAARESLDRLRDLRSSMLSVLLSGEHEIPGTYDQVLELSEGKQTE